MSIVLLVSGCSFGKNSIEKIYELDRIEVEGSPIVIRCSQEDIEGEYQPFCSNEGDYVTSIQVNSETIVVIRDYNPELKKVEFKYELSDDRVLLIEEISTEENPTIYFEDDELVFDMRGQYSSDCEAAEGEACLDGILTQIKNSQKRYFSK